jgi:DNA invertase Pin-like site-specific DNA recombinase
MTNRRTRRPSEPSQTPRTFGYCRVSTTQQADEGHSLADQQSRIVGYCQANGLPAPTEIFVDAGTSGTTSLEKREAGARLLAAVERGDHIIVTKGDRLFRSAKNALNITEDLREQGVSLHLMDMGGEVLNSSISRVIFGVMMMFATLEAERIGERTRSVKEHQRQQGLYVGGTLPFGYVRKGRRVVASPAGGDVLPTHCGHPPRAGHHDFTQHGLQDCGGQEEARPLGRVRVRHADAKYRQTSVRESNLEASACASLARPVTLSAFFGR